MRASILKFTSAYEFETSAIIKLRKINPEITTINNQDTQYRTCYSLFRPPFKGSSSSRISKSKSPNASLKAVKKLPIYVPTNRYSDALFGEITSKIMENIKISTRKNSMNTYRSFTTIVIIVTIYENLWTILMKKNVFIKQINSTITNITWDGNSIVP